MFNNPVFSKVKTQEYDTDIENSASMRGICLKTLFLLFLTTLSALATMYFLDKAQDTSVLVTVLIASTIGGFIAMLIGRMNSRASKFCGVIYAACEGLWLGTLTGLLEMVVPGVGSIAVVATLITFLAVLLIYSTKLIKVNSKFAKFGLAFGIGAILLSITIFIMYSMIPALANNIGLFVLCSAVLLIYGCICLMMNFEEAVSTVGAGVDKDYEWVVALGLSVSIIYIYVELLRIIAVIASRKD